jgi:hypothetical protein
LYQSIVECLPELLARAAALQRMLEADETLAPLEFAAVVCRILNDFERAARGG